VIGAGTKGQPTGPLFLGGIGIRGDVDL
jgi:hypothetical protein